MRDRAIIERILNAIAIRPQLMQEFADILGMPLNDFKEWVELAQVSGLPEKVFVTCKETEDRELNPVAVFYAVHTNMDIAQRQVDKLTMDFITKHDIEDGNAPPDKFIIIDAPLNP
jgi:hypothetical protein